MEIIDISKRQFNKLKKLELEDEISNDEGEIFLFNNINWKYGKNELNKKFKQNRQKLACFRLKFDFIDVESLNYQNFESKPKWVAI